MSSTRQSQTSQIISQLAARSDYDLPWDLDPDGHRYPSPATPETYESGSSLNQPSMQFSIYCDDTPYANGSRYSTNDQSDADPVPSFDDNTPSVDSLFPTDFASLNDHVDMEHPTPVRPNKSVTSFERSCSTGPAPGSESHRPSQSVMADDSTAFVGEKKSAYPTERTSIYDTQPAPPPYPVLASSYSPDSHPYLCVNPDQKSYTQYSEKPSQSSGSVNSYSSHQSRSKWSSAKQSFYKKAKSVISKFSSVITGRWDPRLDYDKSFSSGSDDFYVFGYDDMSEGDRFQVPLGGYSHEYGAKVESPSFVW